jgi:hypothetical protein
VARTNERTGAASFLEESRVRRERHVVLTRSMRCRRCDKDRGVGIERYVIRIRLRSSSRGEDIVE